MSAIDEYFTPVLGADGQLQAHKLTPVDGIDQYFIPVLGADGQLAAMRVYPCQATDTVGFPVLGADGQLVLMKGSANAAAIKITAEDLAKAGDYFSMTKSHISGSWIFVSTYLYKVGANAVGMVFVFKFDGTTWNRHETIQPAGNTINFGSDLDLQGTTLIIGASQGSDGGVRIYKYTGASWDNEVQYIPYPVGAGSTARFGQTLSVSGTHLVVGAPNDFGTGLEGQAGSAFAYEYDSDLDEWVYIETLHDPFPVASKKFGSFITCQGSNMWIVNLAGSEIWWYLWDGSNWILNETWYPLTWADGEKGRLNARDLSSISYDGTTLAIGMYFSTVPAGGRVNLYTYAGGWNLQQSLTVSGSSVFGSSVNVVGSKLLVGDPALFSGGTGKIHKYSRSGTTWSLKETIESIDAYGKDVGYHVHSDGTKGVSSVPEDSELGSTAGAAYVFPV